MSLDTKKKLKSYIEREQVVSVLNDTKWQKLFDSLRATEEYFLEFKRKDLDENEPDNWASDLYMQFGLWEKIEWIEIRTSPEYFIKLQSAIENQKLALAQEEEYQQSTTINPEEYLAKLYWSGEDCERLFFINEVAFEDRRTRKQKNFLKVIQKAVESLLKKLVLERQEYWPPEQLQWPTQKVTPSNGVYKLIPVLRWVRTLSSHKSKLSIELQMARWKLNCILQIS